MKIPAELLAKYDRPGPRYTSYPTAPQWSASFGPADYRACLQRAGSHEAPLSLYVHVPFCASMCWFCGCNVIISRDEHKQHDYVDLVLREAALAREAMGRARPVVQHHWGGGTPTSLRPDECRRLFAGLCALFPLAPDAEVSIEVDPRVTTPEHLTALRQSGFNRISMGVQDFDPKVQEAIHRVQSIEQTRAIVDGARALGFVSANLDLVYGLPHQTLDGFRRTIGEALAIGPDRVACYSYAHVPWLKKHQSVIPEDALPLGADKLALYLAALQDFTDAGYVPVGMDHFARSSDELAQALGTKRLHRNFMGYTVQPASEMVSFGITAISEVDGAFAQNHKPLGEWARHVESGELPVERGLQRSADDEARRAIILDLMCRFRCAFADHGGTAAFRATYAKELAALVPMAQDGIVELHDDAIAVTELGRVFVRNVCMAFDAYLDQAKAGTGPRYSRTV